jgi:hypothetical protein
MSQTPQPTHHQYRLALNASLEGRFDEALERFSALGARYVHEESLNDQHRVNRDLARVYAGLGNALARDMHAHFAYVGHAQIQRTAREVTQTMLSERAASAGVLARVSIAQAFEDESITQEDASEAIGGGVRLYVEAIDLITRTPHTNPDYREQIIAHGTAVLAVFGERSDIPYSVMQSQDFVARHTTDPRRSKALRTTRRVALARSLGVPLTARIRQKTARAVGGPYMVHSPS